MSDERSPEVQLTHFYQRNGYARLPHPERRAEEGAQRYKKGWEVRLVARDQEELAQLRRLLEQMDFEPGAPFDKANQIVLPLYGKASVQRFLEVVGDDETLKEHAETREAMGVEEPKRAEETRSAEEPKGAEEPKRGRGRRRLTEETAQKREINPRAKRLLDAARKRASE